MNAREFAALKVGDKIEHPMTGSIGEVADLQDNGVVLCWDGNPARHFFSFRSTAWMHWNRVQPKDDET